MASKRKRSKPALEAIESLLKGNPDASLEECIGVALKADPNVDVSDNRSFNARYVLPVKRTMPKESPKVESVVEEEDQGMTPEQIVAERDWQASEILGNQDVTGDEAYKFANTIPDFISRLIASLENHPRS